MPSSRPHPPSLLLLLLAACTPAADETDLPDTDSADTDVEVAPAIRLVTADVDGETAVAWRDWAAERHDVAVVAWDDESAEPPLAHDLVLLLPDLPRDASDAAERLVAHGGPILGLGVGGAYAYDGLDVGLGYADGGQGAVATMEVAEDHVAHVVFAGVTVPEDRVLAITDRAIDDVGIQPSSGVTVLGWDSRYPGSYADLCYNDRFWFWGWGSATEGTPDDLTADGDTVLRAVIDELID